MAESLLTSIRETGYNVGSAMFVDRMTGETYHVVDATDAQTGERWSVQLGWNWEG